MRLEFRMKLCNCSYRSNQRRCGFPSVSQITVTFDVERILTLNNACNQFDHRVRLIFGEGGGECDFSKFKVCAWLERRPGNRATTRSGNHRFPTIAIKAIKFRWVLAVWMILCTNWVQLWCCGALVIYKSCQNWRICREKVMLLVDEEIMGFESVGVDVKHVDWDWGPCKWSDNNWEWTKRQDTRCGVKKCWTCMV